MMDNSNGHFDNEEIKFENNSKYSDEEYLVRVKLAAAYRMVAHLGWGELIYNHLTAKIPGTHNILLNPFGLRFDEVTASSLISVDYTNGTVIDEGNSGLGINITGYVIHGAVHRARPDIESTMHTHSNDAVAVACYKGGLLPYCQNSNIFGGISYHEYEGISVNEEEQERIVASLGPENKNLILRNHGILSCGSSVEECFYNLYELTKSCEIQVKMLSMVGGDTTQLILPPKEIRDRAARVAANFSKQGQGKKEFRCMYRLMEKLDDSFKL